MPPKRRCEVQRKTDMMEEWDLHPIHIEYKQAFVKTPLTIARK
jgi:hypothetical protein